MTFPVHHPAHPTRPAPRKSEKPAPPSNYAGREETMKIAEQIMDERAELFRRLADA